MNFAALSAQEKKAYSDLMFQPLNSVEEVRDWIRFYLDLEIPIEITDPDSTSSPLNAIWKIYEVFKNNTGDVTPGAIIMSCREGMKCQVKGSKILTNTGIKLIEDIGVGDIVWTGFSWQAVTETFDEGMKPGLKVSLKGGWSATGTPIHRYWVLRDGVEQWVAGKDLNPTSDLMCVNVNTPHATNSAPVDQDKYDIGYFLGLLTGDGGLTLMDKYNRVTLSTTDPWVSSFYKKFIFKHFENLKIRFSKNGIDQIIASSSLCEKVKNWGLKNAYSWQKEIPHTAWENIDALKGFIAGVFDTDGCWDKKGDCFFEMTSPALLQQLQIALTSFGIESKLRHNTKLYGLQKHLVSRLSINQTEAAKFKKVGIYFRARKARGHIPPNIPNNKNSLLISQIQDLLNVCSKYKNKIKGRQVKKPPTKQHKYYKGVSYSNLRKMCAWMRENVKLGISVSKQDLDTVDRYEKILKNKWKPFDAENVGNQYFYDLTVENEHSYWSNGLISHNTVSVSLLEILLLLHFQLDVAHAAAVESQSSVGIKYIESFMFKIEPLVQARGWTNLTQNKRTIQYKTPEGKSPYIKVLICTPRGMNSLHANVLFLDELDLADPQALKEAKNIVGYSKGIFGMTVYLSTRKYAFGNMNEALEKAKDMNYEVLNWNILDVTERCPASRHLPDLPKEDRYVPINLPLQQLNQEEYDYLPPTEKPKYIKIEQAHAGCLKCPLLTVCKMRLAAKPESASGGFYKPISAVIQKFRENDADTAESQLMCFGESTRILMGDGTTKEIRDIVVGDGVISHTGLKRKVTETFKRPYFGKAYKVENAAWKHFDDTIVTPEHPYFVNGTEFKSLSDIKPFKFDKWGGIKQKGDYFSLPVNYAYSSIYAINLEDYVKEPIVHKDKKIKLKRSLSGRGVPESFELNKDFGWIVGYFLAEGYFSKVKRNGESFRNAITFCSDERETGYHQKVRDFASRCGLAVSECKSKSSHGYTIDIYSSTLAAFFFALFNEHSDKKTIHPSLIDANLDFLEGVLEGFDAGDGTKRKKSYKELTTTSQNLASQLFLIASRLGLCPRITRKPLAEGRKRAYLVHYMDKEHVHKQNRTKFMVKGGHNLYRQDVFKETTFEGYVYNFEVEEDHSYIANGAAVHNCWRPGSEGLVFPRFKKDENKKEPNKTNVLSVADAYQAFTGTYHPHVSYEVFLRTLQAAGIEFFAGVDWGFTHDAVIMIVAKMPEDEIWVLDCFASPGLEFSDMLEQGILFRDRYNPQKWFCDPAYPANVKSFNKNGMRSPAFTKDVAGGVEALRSKITNAAGQRKLKIIKTKDTQKAIEAMSKHRFLLDGVGNPTAKPDDEPQIADICDTARYIGQNLFPVRGSQKPLYAQSGPDGKPIDGSTPKGKLELAKNDTNKQLMMEEIAKNVQPEPIVGGKGRKGGFIFSF